jgi:diacylglycerol kinase family enzyme
MKVLIINNLQSGLRDGSIFEFMRKLARDGDEIIIRNTDGHTSIESLLTDVETCDLIVAAGGDGTIAPLCYALRSTGLPILPFPAGTGNLLTMNLDQPEEPYALVDLARAAQTLDFDLGELCFETDEGPTTKGFIVAAGAGYDATIMKNSGKLKEVFGSSAYVIAGVANPNPMVARFTIELDDQTVEAEGIAVLLLNFAKIHPDISITRENDARDGLFEIVVVKPHHAVELLPAFFAAFLDRTGDFPYRPDVLEIFKSKHVRVTSDPPIYLQYDGEAPGCKTPFEARILPNAAKLVVSEQEYQRLTAG